MVALRDPRALPKEDRRAFGQRGNQARQALERAYEEAAARVRQAELSRDLEAGAVDVTAPGRRRGRGRLHPTTRTLRRIYAIFGEMGFQIYRSRDVETDRYASACSTSPAPPGAGHMRHLLHDGAQRHPADAHVARADPRDAGTLPEPIRVILPGMCYRYEQITAQRHPVLPGRGPRHRPAHHDGRSEGDADGVRARAVSRSRTRFRADHFPFTEPSAGDGRRVLRVRGAGLSGLQAERVAGDLGCGMWCARWCCRTAATIREFSGFAFGMGPQRITMLMHKIEDIRYFFSNDVRFLEQF